MRVHFVRRDNGPERLICEAEVAFDEDPLDETKLVGFCVWKGSDGEPYVTFPARAFGVGQERRYFDYLCSANGSVEPIKKGQGVDRRGVQEVLEVSEEHQPLAQRAGFRGAPMEGLMAHRGSRLVGRQDLTALPTPEPTETHKPIPHVAVVDALVESLTLRHINVVRDEYAVSSDGMKMFGVLDLSAGTEEFRFSWGVRNANDKSMRLALTVGYRVLVCDNMAFHGDFTPVLAKHSKRVDLENVIALGVDKMQRNFAPMVRDIEIWKAEQLSDDQAKPSSTARLSRESSPPRSTSR